MRVHVLKLFDPPPITIFDPWWRIPQTSSGGLGRSAANNCIASIGFGSAVAVGMFSSATHVSASCCFIGLRLGRGKATLATRLAFHPHRTTKGPCWSCRHIGGHQACGKTGSAATSLCPPRRSEEHTSELQSRGHLVCRLLLEKKKNTNSSSRDW